MGRPRIKQVRVCSICKSDKTYMIKGMYPNWYHIDGELLCKHCYDANVYVADRSWSTKRIRFKDKVFILNDTPRTGTCSKCGKTDCKTDLHHEEYDDNDILAHTIELCISCHSKRSIELGQFAKPFLGKV